MIKEIERKYPNISNEERMQLRDGSISNYQLKHIRYGIDKGFDEKQVRELCNPEYDIWQIKLITVGFDNGVPIEVIRPYIDTTSFLSYEQP